MLDFFDGCYMCRFFLMTICMCTMYQDFLVWTKLLHNPQFVLLSFNLTSLLMLPFLQKLENLLKFSNMYISHGP
jgi:hypothetical protein